MRFAGWLAAAGLSLIVWAVYGHHRDCRRPVCPDFVPDDWPPFRPAGMWEKRDTSTGRFVEAKKTGGSFRGVRREH